MILPPGVRPAAARLLQARALRACADGCIVIVLPAYLLALGHGTWEVGLLASTTLLGSALATLAVGAWGHRLRPRRLLLAAAALMAATGFAFAGLAEFWPLLLVAFVGTLNPGGGDVSIFLPLEHAQLAEAAPGATRTALFARYTLAGAAGAALGSLVAALPDALAAFGVARLDALRALFAAYGLVGLGVAALYAGLPEGACEAATPRPQPLGASRRQVIRLAGLFAVDAFAGGLAIQALLALWLFRRFDLSLAAAASFFFWAGLLTALSQLAAPWLARRIGLLRTMVFTHIPANLCLILAAFAPSLPAALGLLLVRSALAQMDVPTRSAFVMALVTPAERAAAASFTAVPRSLAAAVGPTLGGALFAAGALAAPLVACGLLKIGYDLALLAAFRRSAVAEE